MNEPKRLYLDTEVIHPAGKRKVSIYRTSDADIEYTRTDAFIEKAAKWISEIENGTTITDIGKFVEEFKKAMEL